MAGLRGRRPFDNFRTAITDPNYFFGRAELLKDIFEAPRHVRIILGGRRIGKTSFLRAVEWGMLDSTIPPGRSAFPVFISLDVEQPKSLDNLRYILLRRLREAVERWRKATGPTLRAIYRSYLSQVASAEVAIGPFVKVKVTNLDAERRLDHDDFRLTLLDMFSRVAELGFEGVLYLLDEAEYVVRSPWANDAWSYIRGLKDADMAIKPFLGVVLSGYRDLRMYQQRVGSDLLHISETRWLKLFEDNETTDLAGHRFRSERCQFTDADIDLILRLSGGHPFVAQQVINAVLDRAVTLISDERLKARLLRAIEISGVFSSWWNEQGKSDGFGDAERAVYGSLLDLRRSDEETVARQARLTSNACADALETLAGTGVIRQDGDGSYEVKGELFEDWTRGLKMPTV